MYLKRALVLAGAIVSLSASGLRGSADAGRFSMPINAAETMIVPFWDRALADLDAWTVTPSQDVNADFSSGWDSTRLAWTGASPGQPAVVLTRALDHDLSRYDHIVVHAEITPGADLQIEAETDRGHVRTLQSGSPGGSKEIAVPLEGAQRLRRLTLTVVPRNPQGKSGNAAFKWVMLVNEDRLADVQASWREVHVDDWKDYLVETPRADPAPALELWASAAEIDRLRATLAALPADKNPFAAVAQQARDGRYDHPERLIREYVGWGRDRRYTRERDVTGGSLLGRTALADAGLLLRDQQLLRLAARTALSLATIPHWDAGPTTRSLLSSWETRPFVPSLVASELVYYLDLAGDQFTPAGRNFILRRLAEEGVGSINYSVWRHDYIFGNNQLAVFNHGRVLAYLALERYWKRVEPYTELAQRELHESLGQFLFDDGGYVENPGYYHYTLANVLPTLEAYARARKRPVADVFPAALQKSIDYIELFQSTTRFDAIIPLGDGFGRAGAGNPDVSTRMAAYFPDSRWTALAQRFAGRVRSDASIPLWIALDKIGRSAPPPRAFVHIPSIGTAASVRQLGDKVVKLLVVGHAEDAGHIHEDRGSFVLEYAGEAFAADYDNFPYDDPRVRFSKAAQHHNVLVPIGTLERPSQTLHPATHPEVHGDERTFHASFDLSANWAGWFSSNTRTYTSPSADRLQIHDRYALLRGEGVEFRWHTTLPIAVGAPGEAIIRGERGSARITFAPDLEARVEQAEMTAGRTINTLVLRRLGESGEITVDVTLLP